MLCTSTPCNCSRSVQADCPWSTQGTSTQCSANKGSLPQGLSLGISKRLQALPLRQMCCKRTCIASEKDTAWEKYRDALPELLLCLAQH